MSERLCTWWQDTDEQTYATRCGHIFRLDDGTPDENQFRFCCFCGRALKQQLMPEEDES